MHGSAAWGIEIYISCWVREYREDGSVAVGERVLEWEGEELQTEVEG